MRRIARVLFWLGLLGIAIATLGPLELRPETGLSPQVERCGAFLAISTVLSLAYPRHRVAGLLALILTAALLETLQNAVPGRHGRLADFEAKALGVVIGFGLARVLQVGRSRFRSRKRQAETG